LPSTQVICSSRSPDVCRDVGSHHAAVVTGEVVRSQAMPAQLDDVVIDDRTRHRRAG
jgi:hypothetical protein